MFARRQFYFVILFIFISTISCRIYDININQFNGDATVLSTFGFSENGFFELTINSVQIHEAKPNYAIEEMKKKMGFILKSVESNSIADLESLYRQRPGDCFTNHLKSNYFQFNLLNTTKQVVSIPKPSFYGLFFYHCEKVGLFQFFNISS
jgi:hypothetical protein